MPIIFHGTGSGGSAKKLKPHELLMVRILMVQLILLLLIGEQQELLL
jgi:hypothetical protein